MAASSSFTWKSQFKALLLSQAPPLVPDETNRPDLKYIHDLELSLNDGHSAVTAPQAATALRDFQVWLAKDTQVRLFESTKLAAWQWIQNSFKLFEYLYDSQPPNSRNPKAVYFIVSPELALNGYTAAPEPGAPRKWGAAAPPHEQVEEYITARIRERFATDPRYKTLRVVFVFSMCTCSTFVMPPDYDRSTETGRGTGVGTWTIGAANRITAITSTGVVRQVLKFTEDDADGWKKKPFRNFSQKYAWGAFDSNLGRPISINSKGIQVVVPDRATEISPMELPEEWKDNEGKRIKLSFGTCADAYYDAVHGKSNLTIYVGAGFNLFRVRDTNRPWLMADGTHWNPELPKSEIPKRQPGYYLSKRVNDIPKTVYSTTPDGVVKLDKAELFKVTSLFKAYELEGQDWAADLYMVRRGMREFNEGDHTNAYVWTGEYIDFQPQA